MKTVKKQAAALGLILAILFAVRPVLAADPTPTPQTEVTASFKTLTQYTLVIPKSVEFGEQYMKNGASWQENVNGGSLYLKDVDQDAMAQDYKVRVTIKDDQPSGAAGFSLKRADGAYIPYTVLKADGSTQVAWGGEAILFDKTNSQPDAAPDTGDSHRVRKWCGERAEQYNCHVPWPRLYPGRSSEAGVRRAVLE